MKKEKELEFSDEDKPTKKPEDQEQKLSFDVIETKQKTGGEAKEEPLNSLKVSDIVQLRKPKCTESNDLAEKGQLLNFYPASRFHRMKKNLCQIHLVS